MSIIEISGLTRDYGSGRGVFDLSFSVGEGEAFGFIGPNGAGKTTAIRHLMGFLKPETGNCTVGGLDCWKNRDTIQKESGYISGEINFFNDMSGNEFLKFTAKYRNIGSINRTKELLERFELDPKGKIKKMSKGMKQKIGIVAAFMHDPQTLILDEPTSGLDPLMQNRFIELILEEKKRGKTVLMSSHMFEEVERTCHRVGIIRDGKLAVVDSVDALKAAQVNKYVVTFENSKASEEFIKENLAATALAHNRVEVTVYNNIRDFIAIMNRYPVTNISATNQSLEEIFMKYYGGDK